MPLTCVSCGKACHHKATRPACTACRDQQAPPGARDRQRRRRAAAHRKWQDAAPVPLDPLRAEQARARARAYHEKRKTDPLYRAKKAETARLWREARELERMLG